MNRRAGVALVLLVSLLTGTRPAAAAIPVLMESVESATFHSTVIVRGRVVAIQGLPGATLANDVVTVEVSEVIKGSAGPTVTFLAEWGQAARRADGQCLVFLVPTRFHATGPLSQLTPSTAAKYPLAVADLWQRGPVPLDGPLTKPMYDASLRPLETGPAILEAVRREVAHPPTPPRESIDLDFSPNSRIFPGQGHRFPTDTLDDGVSLRLLLDERAAATARTWVASPDPVDRLNGARVLSNFKSPENVAPLTRLLNDPFLPDDHSPFWRWPTSGEGKWNSRAYPVRELAYRTLCEWRAAVPQTWVLREPKYPGTRFPQWIVQALAGAVLILLVLLTVLVWTAPRHGRRIAVLGGVLLVACAALWARGRWRIDELAFTVGDNRYEVAASAGNLRFMRLDGFTDPAPPAFTTVVRSPETDYDWRVGPASAAYNSTVERRFGFTLERSTVDVGDMRLASVSGTVRLSRLCAVFACPAVLLVGGALLRKYRRATRRCPGCGYDLRATPHACPECGWGRK